MAKNTYKANVIEGTDNRTFQILENGKPMHWMEVVGCLELFDQFAGETRKRWGLPDEQESEDKTAATAKTE